MCGLRFFSSVSSCGSLRNKCSQTAELFNIYYPELDKRNVIKTILIKESLYPYVCMVSKLGINTFTYVEMNGFLIS